MGQGRRGLASHGNGRFDGHDEAGRRVAGQDAGIAGRGLVTVTLSAKGELKGVKLDDSLIKPTEKEILEDLLVAAHTDARRKAEALVQDKMKTLTGGLPLPPGLKLF